MERIIRKSQTIYLAPSEGLPCTEAAHVEEIWSYPGRWNNKL